MQLKTEHTHHFLHFASITFPQVYAVEGNTVYRTRVCILKSKKQEINQLASSTTNVF